MCDACGCAAPTAPDALRTHSTESVDINTSIFSRNEEIAHEIRHRLDHSKTLCINFISSPGAGKTTLMEQTALRLKDKYKLAFLIGDLETERDAERIRKQGVFAFQLTTGGACHLEAPLISKGIDIVEKQMGAPDILFIENVGNLVCPSSYDLGEHIRVVMISTPEGDDKPAKYPVAFRSSNAFLITKTDIVEHFDFDIDKISMEAQSLNPYLDIMRISSKTGEGLDQWIEYIEKKYVEITSRDHHHGHEGHGHTHA